ncbi:MAG: diacylglycerol kinase family protein [Clostridia bacterium]|nr:diacylglycerol kinase family protein [Clostridia bacterium]
MAKAYVLYNPIAGNGQSEETVNTLRAMISDETVFCDMTKNEAYEKDIASMDKDDYIIVCGGDGTLNRFANKTADMNIENDIRYFPCGSGNDFARELGKERNCEPFSIKKYLEDLPTVTINGDTSFFLNGVGYGIDGYCCEVGDKLRETSDKPVNYTSIAIKGLLFHYKPTNAKVTVDGKTHEYKKVWIAPTMNGKYYGGGMMPTPAQDRLADDGKLSVMIFHGSSALKTLMIFPSLFKGEHVKSTKYVEVLEGYDITVEFDEPRSVQVDGETTLNVSAYTAKSKKCAE